MSGIDPNSSEVQRNVLNASFPPIRKLLTNERIAEWCTALDHPWRRRVFCPVVTLLACIWKDSKESGSVREVEDWLADIAPEDARKFRDGSVFCKARRRLPIRLFYKALVYLGAFAQEKSKRLFHNLPVVFMDGTTTKLANTKKNLAAFGASTNQNAKSALPLMRWVVMTCQVTGAVLDVAFGPYTASEIRLAVSLLLRIPSNRLLVADSQFACFLHFGLAQKRGCEFLAPRHRGRKRPNLIRTLGVGDELHSWNKPRRCHCLFPHMLDMLPDQLTVRIATKTLQRKSYRPVTLTLCTTLLDPEEYPMDDLFELYLERWGIEVDMLSMKERHGLRRLGTKSPQTVIREFYSKILAYNMAVALMADSGVEPRRLSHKRSINTILIFASQMSVLPVHALSARYRLLMQRLSELRLEEQDRPPQPRELIQNPRRFPILHISRAAWLKKYYEAG